jgi:hypothetical protein
MVGHLLKSHYDSTDSSNSIRLPVSLSFQSEIFQGNIHGKRFDEILHYELSHRAGADPGVDSKIHKSPPKCNPVSQSGAAIHNQSPSSPNGVPNRVSYRAH